MVSLVTRLKRLGKIEVPMTEHNEEHFSADRLHLVNPMCEYQSVISMQLCNKQPQSSRIYNLSNVTRTVPA